MPEANSATYHALHDLSEPALASCLLLGFSRNQLLYGQYLPRDLGGCLDNLPRGPELPGEVFFWCPGGSWGDSVTDFPTLIMPLFNKKLKRHLHPSPTPLHDNYSVLFLVAVVTCFVPLQCIFT